MLEWIGSRPTTTCVLNIEGKVLGRKRIADTLAGIGELHALVAANYQVIAINPLAAARYRERHHVSGAKSDPGDAKMLADLVRTNAHNHRVVAGDSSLVESVKSLARAHQNAIWSRQRQVNSLRSSLKDYFPDALEAFGTDLASVDAVAVLAVAPTPSIARTLSRAKIVSALQRAGRQRNLEGRAEAVHEALAKEQLSQPPVLENAYGITTKSTVAGIVQLNASVAELEAALSEHSEQSRGNREWCSHATVGTNDWRTRSISGHFARRTGHLREDLLQRTARSRQTTAKPSDSSRIGGSGSRTRVSNAAASTTKRSLGRRREKLPLDKLGARCGRSQGGFNYGPAPETLTFCS